jgi:predicted transcriptional regulator
MTTNKSAFPIGDSVEPDPSPEMMSFSDAGDVMDALSAETAQSLPDQVYETPATASELATTAETSLQNTQYHLNRLQAVGLIEVVGTWYSEKGREMEVYGAKNDPMVIFAGEASEADMKGVISAWP